MNMSSNYIILVINQLHIIDDLKYTIS